jgi:hypothetical protein
MMMSKALENEISSLISEIKSATSYHDRDPLLRKLGALLEEPTTPAELLHEVALSNLGMEVNNRIAQASQASQETLAVLCKNAQHRWEWRSLSHAYKAALTPSVDYSVVFKNKEVEVKDSAEFVLNISVELTAILWQELATLGLVIFYYRQDTDDGDHFGPEEFDFEETAAEYLLSPGYFVDWVTRDEYIDSEYVSERLEDEWGSWDSSIDKIGALEHGAAVGHLEPLQEDVLKSIYEKELLSVGGMEAQFIITDVEPDLPKIKKNLKNKNYEGLSDSIKHEIIVRLIDTLEHPFLGGFKISHHLLKLLLIHPATPEESKALISLVSAQLNE